MLSRAAATIATADHQCAEYTQTCEAKTKKQEALQEVHLQQRVRPGPQPLKPAALPEAARLQPPEGTPAEGLAAG